MRVLLWAALGAAVAALRPKKKIVAHYDHLEGRSWRCFTCGRLEPVTESVFLRDKPGFSRVDQDFVDQNPMFGYSQVIGH